MACVIFDYDGTLHQCIRIYAPAFRLAYRQMVADGQAPERTWSDRELEQWLGYPAGEMWDRFAPQLPRELTQRYSRLIEEEMLRLARQGQARLYPGTEEALDALTEAGHTLILLSNCGRDYLEAHRRCFALDTWFRGFYCAGDYGWIPKEAIFPHIRSRFPGPFAVVGDRHQDLSLARSHGLPFVGCTYGYALPGELEGADALAAAPRDIPGALAGLL